MNKITYANKVDTRTTTDPEINKVTASTLNEVKTIVNETVDQVELNTPAIALNTAKDLSLYQALSEKDAVNGYPGLDSSGKINPLQLPALAVTDTFVVASQVAMLALTAQVGDIAVRTDLSQTFILKTDGSTVLANWQELQTPTDSVASVFGRVGVVTAQNNDYSWIQIDKTTSSLADIATRNFSDLQNIPTTISGYGITDVFNKIEVTALDDENVKLTGDQSISDEKEFTGLVKITDRLELSDALDNSFIGEDSGNSNTSGELNVSVGYQSLKLNTEGSFNTSVGISSLLNNVLGNQNTSIGSQALLNIEGSANVAIGKDAGRSALVGNKDEGSNNIYIGSDTKSSISTTTNNEIVIGDSAIGEGSNKVVLGNDSITDTYLKGHIRGNGAATFASSVGVGATPTVYAGFSTLAIGSSLQGGVLELQYSGSQAGRIAAVAAGTLSIVTNNTEALRLNSDQSATFASNVSAKKLNVNNTTISSTPETLLQFKSNTIADNGGYNIDFRTSSNDLADRFVARIRGTRLASAASELSFFTENGSALLEALTLNSDQSATFASSVTATSFIGVKNEQFITHSANSTLSDTNYNVNSGVSASTTITVPTGLSTLRSWELTSSSFSFTIVAASGVTITIINNSEANDLVIQGKHSAKLVTTSIANNFLLIKY